MVVRSDWKYIGQGAEYVAYLVRDHVVKVPRPYFNDRISRNNSSWDAMLTADFDLTNVPAAKISAWIAYGQQQVENSKYYGSFGVPTYVDSRGLLHQQYVVGRIPTEVEERALRQMLYEQHNMLPGDLHRGNFMITPLGPKIFDYGKYSLHRRKRRD